MRYDQAVRQQRDLGPPAGDYVDAQWLGIHRGQSFGGITGTMAAALASGATVAAFRYSPPAAGSLWMLAKLHLHYACLSSFGAPITAGRRLAMKRGSGMAPSGGTAIDVVRDILIDHTGETLLTGQIAGTAGLTMTGGAYETPVIGRLLLATYGTAGQDYDELWSFDGLSLASGELFGIMAPQAFDAGGTWQLSVKGHGYEISIL